MTFRSLLFRVLAWQTAFTAAAAIALASLPEMLLLVPGSVIGRVSTSLWVAEVLAGIFAIVWTTGLVRSRRALLDHRSGGSRTLNLLVLPKLNDDPWGIVNGWVVWSIGAVFVSMTVFRPAQLSPMTALMLAVFSGVLIAATSLPLLTLVRHEFVRVMERVPPEIMHEVIDAQVRSGRLRGKTSRRLLAAIVTPVAFLGIGSALIAGAHVRAWDAQNRERLARDVGAAVLDSELEPSVEEAKGILRAQAALAEQGFLTRFLADTAMESETRSEHGLETLGLRLRSGTMLVEFFDTHAWPVSLLSIPILVVTVLGAGYFGVAIAGLLSRDLRMANHGVRMLGTDAALEGTRVMRPARFRAVAELGSAIELLASRFRLFAQAQERTIEAREAATRARGRFFASVSHDLKSPLNAILGFTELTSRDSTITLAQQESLDNILSRGRELLALIETILDAARVEAGQLTLERSDVPLGLLLDQAIDKAKDLSADSNALVVVEAPDELPSLYVDHLRFSQALATFIGHARKTAERDTIRVLVDVEGTSEKLTLSRRKLTIFVEVPSARFSAQELEAMLSPEKHPGKHRGLALALRLAKAIVELHGGRVSITGRTVREPAFAITLTRAVKSRAPSPHRPRK